MRLRLLLAAMLFTAAPALAVTSEGVAQKPPKANDVSLRASANQVRFSRESGQPMLHLRGLGAFFSPSCFFDTVLAIADYLAETVICSRRQGDVAVPAGVAVHLEQATVRVPSPAPSGLPA